MVKHGSHQKKAANKLQLERWKQQGAALKAVDLSLREKEFAHQWAIADWMLAGEKAFTKKRAYDEAEKVTGMTRQTLQQFAHTAKRVLTRVKGVSFGHHRLVAKLHPASQRQKKLLEYAKKRRFSVVEFDGYLRGMEKDDARQKDTPTNSTALAVKVQGLCQKLREHPSLEGLLAAHPPVQRDRKRLIQELTSTAEYLQEKAEWLKSCWAQFDGAQAAMGLTKRAAAAGSL